MNWTDDPKGQGDALLRNVLANLAQAHREALDMFCKDPAKCAALVDAEAVLSNEAGNH